MCDIILFIMLTYHVLAKHMYVSIDALRAAVSNK